MSPHISSFWRQFLLEGQEVLGSGSPAPSPKGGFRPSHGTSRRPAAVSSRTASPQVKGWDVPCGPRPADDGGPAPGRTGSVGGARRGPRPDGTVPVRHRQPFSTENGEIP
ncbi:hypothetical protein GCM10009564_05250 [Streptomyces thermogriseus]|uniref:Uncharacterized protein n=1 Tax=Streptomyces thermogriseus TaxID=75292 RepID=A0ABP4DAB8_9ACTN